MASRSVRRDHEQVLESLPLLIAEWTQPQHLLCRREGERNCRTLGGSPGHVRPFGSRLMSPPETGPPQPPGSSLFGFPKQAQQATQFRHTQLDATLVAFRFFSCARVTTSTAWASKASVMWRYQAR